MVIHINKEKGKVTDQRTLDQCCAWLPNGEYVVTIEPRAQWLKKQPRTLNQNALLHVWFKHIAIMFNRNHGDDYWTAEKVKDYFAVMFATDEVTPEGEVWRKPVSTSKMTKHQMFEYMNRIQAHVATEEGIRVPLPDDDKFNDFQIIYS